MKTKSTWPKIGICPHCGAPIYNVATPGELPKAHQSCDCRVTAIYSRLYPYPQPYYPSWPPYPSSIPTWPIITYGYTNTGTNNEIPLLVS